MAMDIEKKLELLKNIRQVDAPPFMLARIKERIHTISNPVTPVQWKWAFGLAGLIMIALNTFVYLSGNKAENKGSIETLVGTMDMSNTNELYHE